MCISSVSLQRSSHEPKGCESLLSVYKEVHMNQSGEKNSYHDRDFPVIIRNELNSGSPPNNQRGGDEMPQADLRHLTYRECHKRGQKTDKRIHWTSQRATNHFQNKKDGLVWTCHQKLRPCKNHPARYSAGRRKRRGQHQRMKMNIPELRSLTKGNRALTDIDMNG